jgi:hypothetical protein
MSCPKRTTGEIDRPGVVVSMQDHARARSEVGPPLRCVSSGYMSGDASCEATIPAHVVEGAWAAELGRSPGEHRFFSFPWRGQIWLAFGLADGEIRGVYCPAHRAAREARSAGCEAQHYAPAAASA